jgi:hypothetical protein
MDYFKRFNLAVVTAIAVILFQGAGNPALAAQAAAGTPKILMASPIQYSCYNP